MIGLLIKYKNPDVVMTFSRVLIFAGVSLLGGSLAWQAAVSLDLLNIPPVEITFGPANTRASGFSLLTIGTLLGLWRIRIFSQKITGILVVHRGMEGMEISQAKAAVPRSFSNGRLDVIDLQEGHRLHQGVTEHPERALRTIIDLPRQISTRITDQESSEVKLAYAGLAPVPLLVAAGYTISSRQRCLIMDRDRVNGWHCLDTPDDEEGILIDHPDSAGTESLAIVIPFSVAIAQDQIPEKYADNTYFIRLAGGPRADSLSSEKKQQRIVKEIYTFLANLKANNSRLDKVHIFLGAQASFCFRLGTIISMSVHPPIAVYQYDTVAGAYSWGVEFELGREPGISRIDLA